MEDEVLSPQTEYKYTPLRGLNSVRLLTLHLAASDEAPIRISLREVSLDESPEFVALSYTWTTEDGDSSLSKHLECDGAFIKITVNCAAALKRIRRVDKDYDFWIDAVCINQSNNDERCHQVRLMRQIYRNAHWVGLWIGEASHTLDEETSRPITELGIQFLHDFALELQQSEEAGQNSRDGLFYQEVVKQRKAFRNRDIDVFSPAVQGLWEILHRPWWGRLWVSQEVSLAREARLLCGNQTLAFEKVEQVIHSLVVEHQGKSADEHEFCADFICQTFPHFVMRKFYQRVQLQKDYAFGKRGPGQQALEILTQTRSLHATDPRDKIYGIQGFFGDSESDHENIFPAPNYSKTAAELYAEVARTIILKTETLDILSTCYGYVKTIPDLPSWTPSFNHSLLEYFSETEFKAAKDFPVVCEASEDPRTLKLKGKRVDAVKHIAETPDSCVYENLECTRQWREWVDLAFSLQSYPTGENISDVLRHTLCWDSNILFNRLAPDEYQENFTAWLQVMQSEAPLETVAEKIYEDELAHEYTHRAEFLICGRSLCTTVDSRLALVPILTVADDLIVVFSGGKLPFVLRDTSSGFMIVGPCYVHGIMDGEAFPQEGGVEDLEWFTLK